MIEASLDTPRQFPLIDLGDILLRPLRDSDSERYFEYMSQDIMKSFLTASNRPTTPEEALREVRYWGGLFESGRSIYWAIALAETDRLIGTAGFNIILHNHARAEISYDLDPAFWSKGIMLKSIKAILSFAENVLELVRIQATVICTNQRSIKVLERCGFYNEGTLRKYEVVDGEHKDYYIYARVS